MFTYDERCARGYSNIDSAVNMRRLIKRKLSTKLYERHNRELDVMLVIHGKEEEDIDFLPSTDNRSFD